MALFRTRSILQLILFGSVVVTVPLIVALITAAFYVDRLAKHGQRSVLEAMAATQSSRMLVEHAVAMERSARQFQVLRDQALLDVYRDRHILFQQLARDMLAQLSLGPEQRSAIEDLASREQMVYTRLTDAQPSPASVAIALEAFPVINAAGREILADSSQRIADSVTEMQHLATRAQNLLLWETLGLIPAAVIFLLLFAALVIKPMGQLHRAIRRLGDGQFSGEIQVGGPDDLRQLGSRLEWMRRRIVALESQKVMFLRHVSHELKTPLTSIREGSELLSEQLVGHLNTEQAEIAGMLRQNSLRLQKLIEDLLSFGMLTRDMLRLKTERLALADLVREVAAAYSIVARAKSLELRLELADVLADGDRDKLKTVVDNLISNAVKYSPAGGVITIALASRNGFAVIDVSDQGPGIDRDERERIFEAFVQGRARSSGPIKGSGLGLSITREFVRLHGGIIEVIDEPVGAHLRISLPCLAEQRESPRAIAVHADSM